MAARKSPPSLRRHKPSYQGVVTLDGRDHYLGHWPDNVKKPPIEVQNAYDARIAEWLANGRRSTAGIASITISKLILEF